MPAWIRSIYIVNLHNFNYFEIDPTIKNWAFFKVFEKGKPKYRLWRVLNPCAEKRMPIQEFINMKAELKK